MSKDFCVGDTKAAQYMTMDWSGVDGESFIHPLAFVSGSTIGPQTKVWQFASVIRGASIGANCTVGSCAIVDGAEIGDGCSVGHGAQLHPGLSAGSEVFFGPGCIVCNDRWPATNKDSFDLDAMFSGFVAVRVMNGASIGAGAVILPGVTIGLKAMVAAGSVVDRDVPDDQLWSRQGLIKIKPEWRERRMRRVP